MKNTLLLTLGTWMVIVGCAKDEQPTETSTTVADAEDEVDADAEAEGSGTDTSGGESSSTTTGTTDTGLTFIPESDMMIESECDPFMQDCPEGEKCVPYASDGGNVWNANKCVQVTGDGAVGDSCTWGGIVEATDDCGADSICWDVMDVDGQAIGVCTQYCEGTADNPICPMSTSCIIINEGSINLCIANCDPLLQDCGAGLGCFWANTAFSCIFTAGEIPPNEPCGYINDCAPGNLCADAASLPSCAGSACCTPFCDLADPACATMGTECVTFFEEGMAPPGYEDVGVCVLPG